jgi:hypothetical protein
VEARGNAKKYKKKVWKKVKQELSWHNLTTWQWVLRYPWTTPWTQG